MQFQVPQFIETEDTIVGSLTFRQFGYLLAGGGLIFFLYFLLHFWFWTILAVILSLISLALAFIRYNDRPLTAIVLSVFKYFWEPRVYLFQGTPAPTGIGANLKNLIFRLKTSSVPLPSFLDRFRSTKEKFEVFRRITGEKEAARRVDYR